MDRAALLLSLCAEKRTQIIRLEERVKATQQKVDQYPKFAGKSEYDFTQWENKKNLLNQDLKLARQDLRRAYSEARENEKQKQLPIFPTLGIT